MNIEPTKNSAVSMHHRKNRVFTLIELLVVIAIIAILLRPKWLFFLLFSAISVFLIFDKKTLNTQIQNVTSRMIAGFGIIF